MKLRPEFNFPPPSGAFPAAAHLLARSGRPAGIILCAMRKEKNVDLNSLTIGEAKELSRMFGGNNPTENNRLASDGDIVIAVLQRGWVAVGRYSQCGVIAELSNGYSIRRWGTSMGLGQLAMDGKQESTILDKQPSIRFHIREAVMVISCNAEAWKNEIR